MASPKQLEAELDAARKRNKDLRSRMEAASETGVCTVLMLGTTFAASAGMEKYRDEKTNDVPNIGGAPLDGIAGGLLIIADVMELGGSASTYMGAIGEGLAASFAARAGSKIGSDSRKKSGTKVSGDPTVRALPQNTAGGAPAYGGDAFAQFMQANAQGGMVPR